MFSSHILVQRLRLHKLQIPREMLDLIETELTRVTRMANHADDDGYLLYLLDMAILQANLGLVPSPRIAPAPPTRPNS